MESDRGKALPWLEELSVAPVVDQGFFLWRGVTQKDGAQPVFVGRLLDQAEPWAATGEQRPPLEDFIPSVVARLAPTAPPAAWLRQIHGADVAEAQAGFCGAGDALVAVAEGAASPAVVTADCVPVLLALELGGTDEPAAEDTGLAEPVLGAAHAGWRGLVAGVLPRVVDRLRESSATHRRLRAWVGPTIGPCCYEVDEEVAQQVIDSTPEGARASVSHRPKLKPHLDLPAVAAHQLHAAGVEEVTVLRTCTRCHPQQLWSYRGHGPRAGRNLAFIYSADAGAGRASTGQADIGRASTGPEAEESA